MEVSVLQIFGEVAFLFLGGIMSYKTLALIGEDAPKSVLNSLCDLGFEVLILARDPRLSSPVSSHADMLVFPVGNKIFASSEYIKSNRETFARIEERGYTVVPCNCDVKNLYPHDIHFNVALIEKVAYGNMPFVAKEVKEYLASVGVDICTVKQGYAKCSTVVLNGAIITADSGIAKAAKTDGVDTLIIKNSAESVRLDGYEYGFLGGACGYLDGTLYFCGDISKHPQYYQIAEFAEAHSTVLCSLGDDTLCDVGGIFFI